MFVVVVKFRVSDSHCVSFEDALLKNASDTLRMEDGCLIFDVAKDPAGTLFFLYEVYENEGAFQPHIAMPHFKAFSEATNFWVERKEVETFQMIGQPGWKSVAASSVLTEDARSS